MPKLKALLDSVADIPEALKEFYKESDGKFVLQIDGIKEHPDTKPLQTALENAKTERQTARDERDALKTRFAGLPDDFTVDDYNRLKDAGGGDIDKRLAEQKERLETQFKAKEQALTAERDKYKNVAEGGEKSRTLTEAIAAAGVAPQFVEGVTAMFEKKLKVAYEGDAVITTIDSMPVKDAIKAWAGTDAGKAYIAATDNNGGGAGGNKTPGAPNTSGNPWAKDSFNLTEQMSITTADPAKAEQLKKAAGAK